jgi:hypothetical protein
MEVIVIDRIIDALVLRLIRIRIKADLLFT